MATAKSSSLSFSKIIGVLLLLAAAAMTIFIKCQTKTQLFIIYTLVGLGIALLLVRSASKTKAEYKQWNLSVVLTGGVALPFILFFTNPVGSFQHDNCFVKQSITVFVHGKKGRQDMILRQQGHVIMDLGSERKRAEINGNGEAYFQNLQIGDSVRLNIDFSEPYKSLFPDSVYKIGEDGRIYLAVSLQGIEKVNGMVLLADNPLPDVSIKINKLSTITDSMGQFSLNIPDSLQSNKYTIWFYKKGYKAVSKDAYPQTGIPLSIIMEK